MLRRRRRCGTSGAPVCHRTVPPAVQRRLTRPSPTLVRLRGLSTSVPLDQRGVVAEQLQRDDVEDRRQHAVVFGQVQDVHAFGLGDPLPASADNSSPPRAGLPRLDLSFRADCRLGHGDDRHFLVHQGQRAVFEFAGGVGFGVDVEISLSLSAPSRAIGQCCRARGRARGACWRNAGPTFDLGFELEHLGDGHRQVAQAG